jgi:hypothetical protein
MKFRNRGIIRIKTPAISAMIVEMCAAGMVIGKLQLMRGFESRVAT